MDRKAAFTIFLVVLTDLIGFGIIIPIFPQISSELGIEGFALGLLMASYSVAQFISAPLLGRLSDQIGRKPVLVLSKAGSIIAYLLLAYTKNYQLLFLSRLIDGFTGGNIPAARAYISDITTPQNRSKGMALIGIAFGLGFIIGPAIGGFTFSISGDKTLPGLVGASLSLLSLLLTQFLLKEKFVPQKNLQSSNFVKSFFSVLNRPYVRTIMFIQLVYMLLISGYQTTLSFFADEILFFTPKQNSLLFIYIGFLALIIQGSIARKGSKNNYLSISIGLLLSFIGVSLSSLSSSPLFLYLSLLPYAIGSGLVGVFLPTVLSTSDSKDPEGEIMGVFESVGSLGRIFGPTLAASFITFYPRQTFLVIALFILLLTFFQYKKSRSI